ncbi:MAG: hypothetical protein AB8H86_21365 [Polyangiales bacterium]
MTTFVGGCRVGLIRASMPLARLSVDARTLKLSGALGTFSFATEDVVRVEKVSWFPVLASGVRIVHVREDVAERVIFWHITPSRVFAAINASGFESKASSADMPVRVFPFRIPFLIACVLMWNASFFLLGSQGDAPFGVSAFVPAGLACLTALGILLPTPIRTLALREPHNVRRVKPAVSFVAVVCGILCVAHLMLFL